MRASASSAESYMYPAGDLSIPSQRMSQTSRRKGCANIHIQLVEDDIEGKNGVHYEVILAVGTTA